MTTPPSTRQEVTQLLGDWSGGDEGTREKLFPLVQRELHRLAHQRQREVSRTVREILFLAPRLHDHSLSSLGEKVLHLKYQRVFSARG